MRRSRTSKLSAARIALGYAVIASLWVAFSDELAVQLRIPAAILTVKGVVFVWTTAFLLYFTIRKLIEAIQSASRERDEVANLYQSVVEACGEGITVLDDSGQISFVNRRMAVMLGRRVDELRGKRLQDFIDLEVPSKSDTPVITADTQEFQLQTDSKNVVWVLMSSNPLVGTDGRNRGAVAVLLDVTERKRLEEELRHSQKLEALGSFAGGIAHDFNNLLSIITGYGSLLRNAVPAGSQEENACHEVLRACERGARLVRQLLAFSRKQPLTRETIELCETVRRFGEVLPRLLGDDITVQIECEPTASTVNVGAGQIEQVLMNLAANARDAMPSGGAFSIVTRTVEVEPNAARVRGIDAGVYVALEVSDTGTGIDPELKERIFDPFFTTKPQGAGTGLGLSTVYGIAAQNGGFITCDSSVGQGTTFTVYLPLSLVSVKQDEAAQKTPKSITGTETVLLVEDEPALRALTRHILVAHGYVVLEATNGVEALRLMDSNPKKVDLLLTDVVMPGMSGIELADKFTCLSPQTRIVFMSGFYDAPNRTSGNVHIIEKPVAPDVLLLQLRTLLDEPAPDSPPKNQA